MTRGLVYLCGHLHDLSPVRFVTQEQMYTFHRDKDLELELVDWKKNRAFRLVALDHGLLSFTDVRYGQWPVVLPTWPKSAEFLMPSKENVAGMVNTTHIRVLVFSDVAIRSVHVTIGDEESRVATASPLGPLYLVPWTPDNYKTGLHNMVVTATDANNRTARHNQQFTLDDTMEGIRFNRLGSSFVLKSSFTTAFHVLFGLVLGFTLACLLYTSPSPRDS